MKILLVNNNTRHLDALKKALVGHELEILTYKPGVVFSEIDKDIVVLSGGGGEGYEIDDEARPGKLWYNDEMDYVLSSKKPILGICMGFEVIVRAYGGQVKELNGLVQGYLPVSTTTKGRLELNKKSLKQFESHQWHVPDVSTKQFDILADSTTGIELIKHRTRSILASQFHPEKGGTLKLKSFIAAAVA